MSETQAAQRVWWVRRYWLWIVLGLPIWIVAALVLAAGAGGAIGADRDGRGGITALLVLPYVCLWVIAIYSRVRRRS